jgi:hypothetical protein
MPRACRAGAGFLIPMKTFNRNKGYLIIWGVGLYAILCIVYLLYYQGFSGGPWYDDLPNLADVQTITDLESALIFISQGKGGPLGRPLAVASFILNGPSWPDQMEDFLHTNTCIHLLNGLILIWLCYRMIGVMRPEQKKPEWLALIIGLLWLGQPLLISASLMTVQRMTTLSATFSLTGLLLFVIGYSQIKNNPKKSFWLISCGITGGTLLSALSKETGLLTPLYALVMQATILSGVQFPSWFIWWRRLFLIFPQLAIISYILLNWHALTIEGYAIRDFTPTERVITQARVLLDYLVNIIVARRTELGPIHDDYSISRGLLEPISTLPSIVFWILIFASSLIYRKRYPVLSFTALWFLAGHSIESNIFSLEMYFEHRNYLPSIGPVFAICFMLWSVQDKWKYLARGFLVAYIILVLTVSNAASSLWGDRPFAVRLWHSEHLSSERGAQTLAMELFRHGDFEQSRQVIFDASIRHPENIGLALQTLQTSCGRENEHIALARVLENSALLRQGSVNSTICESLRQLTNLTTQRQCGRVKPDSIHRIASFLLQNERILRVPLYTYCVHSIESMLYTSEGNFSEALQHLEIAFDAYPFFIGDAEMLAALPASAGLKKVALEKIEYAMSKKPRNPFLSKQWEARLLDMKNRIMEGKDAP